MNVMWIIGVTGSKICYLNITQEEAERRYLEEVGYLDPVQKLEFSDTFGSSNIEDAVSVEKVTNG